MGLFAMVQHNRMRGVATRPVLPHVALALGGVGRPVEYMEGGFVRVEHLALAQYALQTLIN